jgi:hypothetical protein
MISKTSTTRLRSHGLPNMIISPLITNIVVNNNNTCISRYLGLRRVNYKYSSGRRVQTSCRICPCSKLRNIFFIFFEIHSNFRKFSFQDLYVNWFWHDGRTVQQL